MSTLRQASAFAFERLALVSPSAVFESIQSSLEQYLSSSDTTELVMQGKEAAILVLGAISDESAAYSCVEPHLSTLLPLLCNYLDDSPLKLKITTAWTLSKFSYWIAELSEEEIKQYVQKL
jgi:transportin-1